MMLSAALVAIIVRSGRSGSSVGDTMLGIADIRWPQ